MVQYGKYVFVNRWSYQNRIPQNRHRDRLGRRSASTVGIQPASLAMDRNNKLWTVTDGGLRRAAPRRYEAPSLYRIDAETLSVEKQFRFREGGLSPEMQLNGTRDTLYWIDRDVHGMPVAGEQLPVRPFPNTGDQILRTDGRSDQRRRVRCRRRRLPAAGSRLPLYGQGRACRRISRKRRARSVLLEITGEHENNRLVSLDAAVSGAAGRRASGASDAPETPQNAGGGVARKRRHRYPRGSGLGPASDEKHRRRGERNRLGDPPGEHRPLDGRRADVQHTGFVKQYGRATLLHGIVPRHGSVAYAGDVERHAHQQPDAGHDRLSMILLFHRRRLAAPRNLVGQRVGGGLGDREAPNVRRRTESGCKISRACSVLSTNSCA